MKRGQMLVELLLAVGIVAVLVPVLLSGIVFSNNGPIQRKQRFQATELMRETVDAVRSIRENSWSNIMTNGTYHPVVIGSAWSLAPGPDTINGLTRQVVISDVYRDAGGAIVLSGGVLDPSTKLLTTSVSWTTPYPSSIQTVNYLARTQSASFTHTTTTDFNAGVNSGTAVVATTGTGIPNDGQVELGTGGGGHGGDWCAPNLNLTSISLPQASSTNAIYAVPGKAFVGIGDISSQGQGENFVAINITQTYPPSASIQGGPVLNIDNVYGDFGDSQYAYLALDNTSTQMQIVDTVTGNQLTLMGYYKAPISSRGNSVYVVGTKGYLTAGNKLFSIDLSSLTGSRPALAGSTPVTLAATGVKVIVVGTYAYVINSGTSNQFQIINLSNYTVSGTLTINNQPARDLVMNSAGDRAYVVTKASGSQSTFYIVNTDDSHKTSPTVLASTGTGGMDPKGINILTGNKAIVVGLGGTTQYQVFKTAGDVISTCGSGLSVPGGIYGIASVLQSNGDAYSYITTGDSKFRVILGGNGAQFNVSGTYESGPYDTMSIGNAQSAFNRFTANISQQSQTTIQMQVAAAPAVGGSCANANYVYVGPGGNTGGNCTTTPSNCFTPSNNVISGVIPYGNYPASPPNFQNPARCFKYKIWMSTNDVYQTPILYDMTVFLSP